MSNLVRKLEVKYHRCHICKCKEGKRRNNVMKYEDMVWDKWNEDEEEYNDSNGNLKINKYVINNGDNKDEEE